MEHTDSLVVIWSSRDREVALNMVFMYTLNAMRRGWFSSVNLIVWGPSAKLLTDDSELKKEVMNMISEGVKVEACLRCADNYEVTDELKKLGIDVKLMGLPLSDYLKEGRKVLTF